MFWSPLAISSLLVNLFGFVLFFFQFGWEFECHGGFFVLPEFACICNLILVVEDVCGYDVVT